MLQRQNLVPAQGNGFPGPTAVLLPCKPRAHCHGCPKGRRACMQWQQQQQAPHMQHLAVATATTNQVSYEWSWRNNRGQLPEEPSDFDNAHQLPVQVGVQELMALLEAAAAAASSSSQQQQPSQQWMDALLLQSMPLLQQMTAGIACEACQHLSQIDFLPEPQWMEQLMQQVCEHLSSLSTQQLSGLLWSLSSLRHTPRQQHWQVLLQASQAAMQDFYGPDLARLICAAGSIYSSSNSSFDLELSRAAQTDTSNADAFNASHHKSTAAVAPAPAAATPAGLTLPEGWSAAVAAEVEYQVVEFLGDLGAIDVARLASGLADLGITPAPRLQEALLKGAYMCTRSMEEKGAVDFALAKLDAKGKKSMHYDPRWTHEELKWLPRRERDKRRILKEGWYRTQWSGWKP